MAFVSISRMRLRDLHRWRSWHRFTKIVAESWALAWLGPGSEKTDQALLHFQHLWDSGPAFGMELANDILTDVEPRSLEGSEESIHQLVEAAGKYGFESIYASPWFTHLWIVQEVTFAPSPTICCRDKGTYWENFAAAMMIISAANGTIASVISDVVSFRTVLQIIVICTLHCGKHQPTVSKYSTFASLAFFLRHQKCQEDHDRVYATLGLVTSDIRSSFHGDYTMSVEELYTRLIRTHTDLNVDIETLYEAGLAQHLPCDCEPARPSMSSPLPTSPPSTLAVNSELDELGNSGGLVADHGTRRDGHARILHQCGHRRFRLRPRGWYRYGRNTPASHLVLWLELRRAPLGPASAT